MVHKSLLGTEWHRADVVARFWSHVEKAGDYECWPWRLLLQRGYGRFTVAHGVVIAAHRVAYELTTGSIPAGRVIDHLCRNPRCVNPAHLEAVTSDENVRRGIGPTATRARQTVCRYGHPLAGDGVQVRKEGWRTCVLCNRRRGNEASRRKRARHKAAGLCAWCSTPRESNRSHCARCADRKRQRERAAHMGKVAELGVGAQPLSLPSGIANDDD